MNLKAILMHLGNALVARGYYPAQIVSLRKMRSVHRGHDVGDPWGEEKPRNGPYCEDDMGPERLAGLELIVLLTEWLNANPDAQECLADLGVEWPVVQRTPSGRGRNAP